MEILNLIRANENWEEIITNAPYYIKTQWDGNYVLLKYNQLASDFNEKIVRECRGAIFYIPSGGHEWADVVCYPFEKFGNYGESYVPEIDWNSARVLEKVDGSLIKLWYHEGDWHVSTNGCIDARKAETSEKGISFYNIFIRALLKQGNPEIFFATLDINYTYMFELVSPETRVTIEYPEPALYYLGERFMCTHQERAISTHTPYRAKFLKFPKVYNLNSLEDCIKVVNQMGADEEGFVVCDKNFNRVKVKSPEYLIASKIRNNNTITTKRVIEAMRAGMLDDFYAYAEDKKDFIDAVVNSYHSVAQNLEEAYQIAKDNYSAAPDIPWYKIVTALPKQFQGYCFMRHANKVENAYDFINEHLSKTSLMEWIDDYIKELH